MGFGEVCIAAFDPLGSAFESPLSEVDPMAFRSQLIRILEYLQNLNYICADYFQKVHVRSPLHRQIISQIKKKKRSGVGVEAVWSTPTQTPGSLPRLRATPTPTPHPCQHALNLNYV